MARSFQPRPRDDGIIERAPVPAPSDRFDKRVAHTGARPDLVAITAPSRSSPPGARDTDAGGGPDASISVTKPRLERLQQAQRELSSMVALVIWARQAEVRAVKALWELNDLRPEGELAWSHRQWEDLDRAMGDFRQVPPDIARVTDPPQDLRDRLSEYQETLSRARVQVDDMERDADSRAELARTVHRLLSDLQSVSRDIGDAGSDRSTELASEVQHVVSEILRQFDSATPDLTTRMGVERRPPSGGDIERGAARGKIGTLHPMDKEIPADAGRPGIGV